MVLTGVRYKAYPRRPDEVDHPACGGPLTSAARGLLVRCYQVRRYEDRALLGAEQAVYLPATRHLGMPARAHVHEAGGDLRADLDAWRAGALPSRPAPSRPPRAVAAWRRAGGEG